MLGAMDATEWIKRRQQEIEKLTHKADAVGREAWAAATRTGENLAATRPSDVVALGARVLSQPGVVVGAPATAVRMGRAVGEAVRGSGVTPARPAAAHAQPSRPRPVSSPGAGRAEGAVNASSTVAPRQSVSSENLTGLRRQQAAFREEVLEESKKNSWMAVPALAPAAVVVGLEGLAFAAARAAAPAVSRLPLNLAGREPALRVGDNWATRAGRLAHKALKERLEQKEGWDYEPRFRGPNGLRKPDVGAPARNPTNSDARRLMELKPDTPSGRRAAERVVREYQAETGNKTRAIYYNPEDYM